MHMLNANTPEQIVKRDGRTVPFDESRISEALRKCYTSTGITPSHSLEYLARMTTNMVSARWLKPTIEDVQDCVERVLHSVGDFEACKEFILYREKRATARNHRAVPQSVRDKFAEAKQHFPTAMQEFQFLDKYSRFNYTLGRRETWVETVDRTVAYLRELASGRLEEPVFARIRSAILKMDSMPSMRMLAMAGDAARRNNICIYNCSYVEVDSLEAFAEALLISMCGCGVGFSVERENVEQLPRIQRQKGVLAVKYWIADTTEGWQEAADVGLKAWFAGLDVEFDYSGIRPEGTPLRTKGGRASGPGPLRTALNAIRHIILERQGGHLRPIDAHDIMCHIGQAAVCGGVRRTAMISLFDFDDYEMRRCKDDVRGNEQRYNANNSAVWPDRELNQQEIGDIMLGMTRTERGEPGIFNRRSSTETMPKRRSRRSFLERIGTNPCVTADTWVMTTEGAKQVKDLTAAPFTAVVNGKAYPAKAFWETGVKKVFRLRTKEGHTLRLTEDHKLLCVTKKTRQVEKTDWIPLKDIKEGMAIKLNDHRESHSWSGHGTFDEGWLLGLLIGDGTFANDYAKLSFWGEHRLVMLEKTVATLKANLQCSLTMKGSDNENKELASVISVELKKLAERYGIFPNDKLVTPKAEEASSEFYRGLLRGLFDTDGTIGGDQKKGVSVRLSQVKVELLYAVQRMLLRLGIASTVYKNRTEAGKRLLPDGKGGMALYHCEAMHELVIAKSNLKHFAEVVGFTKPDKKEKLEARLSGYARELNREPFAGVVESITEDGEEMVYDTTVDEVHCFDANGIVAHNCGEIALWSMQFCNLTIAVARAWDTPETLKEKVEIATIIGTIQSMATHFPGLRPKWKENCEEERLLGVDINGQMDCPVSRDPAVQRMLRDHAVEVNRIYAAKLGINQSAAITCVKPSGNSSVLLDCSPGLHARWAPYYIRNARVSASSSVYKVMRDVGVSMDPENGQTRDNATKWVVHFPTKSPDGAITRNDKTALEQCDYWLQCKQNYTEHNPSVTITYRPHEIFDIVLWVYRNQNVIGGMTFYPTDDARYEQPAYEEITRERYEELAAAFPQIDFAEIYRYEAEDHTTAAQELACAGGSCTREGN